MDYQSNNGDFNERPISSQKDGSKWLHLDDDMGFQPGLNNIIKTHKFTLIALFIFIFAVIRGRVYGDHSYSLLMVFAIIFLLIPSTIECYHSRFIIAKLFSLLVIGLLLLCATIWVLGSRGGIFPLW